MTTIWSILGIVVALGWVAYRLRLHEALGRRRTPLSDDQVRRIEETGSLELEPEDPLDMEEIEKAEDEFWEETWDEPEEW